jgi:hypothetical protein
MPITEQSVEYIDEEIIYRAAGISITECVFLRITRLVYPTEADGLHFNLK